MNRDQTYTFWGHTLGKLRDLQYVTTVWTGDQKPNPLWLVQSLCWWRNCLSSQGMTENLGGDWASRPSYFTSWNARIVMTYDTASFWSPKISKRLGASKIKMPFLYFSPMPLEQMSCEGPALLGCQFTKLSSCGLPEREGLNFRRVSSMIFSHVVVMIKPLLIILTPKSKSWWRFFFFMVLSDNLKLQLFFEPKTPSWDSKKQASHQIAHKIRTLQPSYVGSEVEHVTHNHRDMRQPTSETGNVRHEKGMRFARGHKNPRHGQHVHRKNLFRSFKPLKPTSNLDKRFHPS